MFLPHVLPEIAKAYSRREKKGYYQERQSPLSIAFLLLPSAFRSCKDWLQVCPLGGQYQS